MPFFRLTAQSNEVSTLTWFQYKGSGNLSEKWGLLFDLQHRRIDFLDYVTQNLIRPGMVYHTGKNLRITVGNAFFWHNIVGEDIIYRFELRPYQFVQWRQELTRFSLKHKVRFEQRFNKNTSGLEITNGYRFNFRTGYRADVVIPINRDWAINLYEELLINIGKREEFEFVDQNRIYAGLMVKTGVFTVKSGYMWALIPQMEDAAHMHIIRLGINHEWK